MVFRGEELKELEKRVREGDDLEDEGRVMRSRRIETSTLLPSEPEGDQQDIRANIGNRRMSHRDLVRARGRALLRLIQNTQHVFAGPQGQLKNFPLNIICIIFDSYGRSIGHFFHRLSLTPSAGA